MKYFLAIMACVMLDLIDPIEPVGCSRDVADTPSQVETPAPTPATTPAE